MKICKWVPTVLLLAMLLFSLGSMGDLETVLAEDSSPPATSYGGGETEIPPEEDVPVIPVTEINPEDADLVDETLLAEPLDTQPINDEIINVDSDLISSPLPMSQPNLSIDNAGIEGSFGNNLLDNFNRADSSGYIGTGWTVQDGDCSIVNNHVICDATGFATYDWAPGGIHSVEMDVAVSGTSTQYGAMVMNYAPGQPHVFVKVQQQSPYTGYNSAACYTKNNGGPSYSFGPGFFYLTSPFSSAHMITTRAGDTVTLKFTNIDGGSQPDQIYVCEGAPPVKGDKVGIGGYNNTTKMDNFSTARGPRVLLLEADKDIYGDSPLQTALEDFGDLGEVDLFDAQAGTPTLDLLLSYDVVITWPNYLYEKPVILGNRLADYVDAGGRVINSMFSMGTHNYAIKGRFMDEAYSALNGTFFVFHDACMVSIDRYHPVMSGLTNICDYYRLKDTYLTLGSQVLAEWDDGEIFVAAKKDRSVISIAGYIGKSNSKWTGQMNELIHNSINWLYRGNDILWDQPYHPDYPTTEFANQDFESAFETHTAYLADDFIVEGPWRIRSIFMPMGWSGSTNLANADQISIMIFEDDGGKPANDFHGGGDPPIFSMFASISASLVTLYSGPYDTTTNVFVDIPVDLPIDPGHYWLVVTPSMDYIPFGQIGSLQASTNNGYIAQWINPGGGFGKGTDWQDWSATYATEHDVAFRIEGEAYDVWMPLIKK